MSQMNPPGYPFAWGLSNEDVVFPASSKLGTGQCTWGRMLVADRIANMRLATKRAWYRGSVAGLARQRIQTAHDFGVELDPHAVY